MRRNINRFGNKPDAAVGEDAVDASGMDSRTLA
jgi:hypothetical protein